MQAYCVGLALGLVAWSMERIGSTGPSPLRALLHYVAPKQAKGDTYKGLRKLGDMVVSKVQVTVVQRLGLLEPQGFGCSGGLQVAAMPLRE